MKTSNKLCVTIEVICLEIISFFLPYFVLKSILLIPLLCSSDNIPDIPRRTDISTKKKFAYSIIGGNEEEPGSK